MREDNRDQTQEMPVHEHWQHDTARWTSGAYRVQFDTVKYMPGSGDDDMFDVSAWGISHSLRHLLADYRDEEIRNAAEWLAGNQSTLVANLLEDMAVNAYHQGEAMPPLQNLFIATNAELFLPRGLKIVVSCVTNIVPRREDDTVDKFVAVLDPSEAQLYIQERADGYMPRRTNYVQ